MAPGDRLRRRQGVYIFTPTKQADRTMSDLTPRQSEILALIRDTLEGTGMPPTRAEIAAAFGFSSPNAAEGHLRALARKGAIELIPGSSRGIRLALPEGLPLVGRVAAGSLILAQEHIEEHYRLDPRLFTPRADYLLRVSGMSMRDAGILDGDLLAVHRTAEARNGQVVVARLGDEVTVKRLQRDGRRRVLLVAENPEFAPIEVDLAREPLTIEGIGVGVVRHGRPL
jgi:repressor LexA